MKGFRKNRIIGELFVFLLACALLLGLGAPLYAADDRDPGGGAQPQNEEPGTEELMPEYDYTEPEFEENRTSYSLLILRTIAVLAVIIIAIYLVFRFLLKGRRAVSADTDMIKVLATFPIAANRLIKVVDIAGKLLVLGVTDSNINLITEVEDKETADRIKLLSSKESAERGTFREQFFKLLGGKGVSKTNDTGYLRGYKDRINRMKKL